MPIRDTKYFLPILTLIMLGLFALTIAGLFSALILGILLAALSYPLYRSLLPKLGSRENLSALLTLFAVALVVIIPFLGILTLLGTEAFQLFQSVRDEFLVNDALLEKLTPIAEDLGIDLKKFVDEQLTPAIKNLGLTISQSIGGLLSSAFNLGLHLFVMVMACFYMLRDGKIFGEYLIKLSPMRTDKEIGLFETFRDTGKAVFYGNFISAVAQGVLGGIGFAIFGVGSPVFWGAIMAFFSLIPLLGPFVVFIPASIYLLAVGDTTTAIIFLLYNILIVSSVDNLIKPRIISGRVNVHPLIMLLAILGGLSAFGIMGIIYGPLIATLFLAVLKVYLEEPKPIQ